MLLSVGIRLTIARHRFRRALVACSAFATLIVVFGCDDQSANPAPDREHNPDAPTGNALVSGHHVGGDPTKGSSIYQIDESPDGTWFARGLDDGVRNLSRLGAHGVPLWSNRVQSERLQGMASISSPWLQVGAITTGTVDSDGDGQTNYSVVKAWSGNGTLLDEIVLTGGQVTRHAAGIVVSGATAERLDLFVVGSIDGTSGGFSPWVQRVAFRSDSTLERGDEKTYPQLGLCHLFAVKRDAVGSAYYVGGNVYSNDSTIANAVVVRLSDSLDVEWRTDLVATPGLVTTLSGDKSIDWTGTNVIAVGRTQVVKEKAPAHGGYWEAGLIVSLSPEGVVQWTQSVALTAHTERFSSCRTDGAYAYAVGTAGSFYYVDSDRNFSYGLVTRFDPTTGEVLANYTFGDPGYASGFNDVMVHGTQGWCGGYTERDISNRFRSWFVELDFTRPVALFARDEVSKSDANLTSARPAQAAFQDDGRPDLGMETP